MNYAIKPLLDDVRTGSFAPTIEWIAKSKDPKIIFLRLQRRFAMMVDTMVMTVPMVLTELPVKTATSPARFPLPYFVLSWLAWNF